MYERLGKVALLFNRGMAASIFRDEDLAYFGERVELIGLGSLPEAVTEDFVVGSIGDADACVTCWGTPPFTDRALDSAPRLRFIAHAAGSVKHMLPEGFFGRGIRISSNAPVLAEDVAQTALALILSSLKQLTPFALATRRGEWSGGEKSVFRTKRLGGLRVGLVGGSLAGRATARILKPFGCAVYLYDPYITPNEARELGVTVVAELNDLIRTSDVISLHAPAIPDCRHMINASNAPLIKDGALFVNTARGMLVDEEALIKELETGRFFACLDVTDPEPPAPDHPFRTLENVFLTPHIAGGHTENGRYMLGANAIDEVLGYLSRGLIKNEIRREMLDLMA